MAVRRQAWQIVQDELSLDDDLVHEDQDFSLCMAYHGLRIREAKDVKIYIDGQTYRYLPKFWRYVRMQRSTLKYHRAKGTFRSRRFPRQSLVSLLPGALLAAVLSPLFVLVFSLILFPLDWVMIQLVGADEWLGNSDN